ncbi:MAG: MarC family protein [Candidatus Micrarchaeota archaeon]|nr:MarC family protein [Candidatus Micrarchaeota archaeon]
MLAEFVFATVSLIVVYNPFSKVPIFLSLTSGMKDEERNVVANRSIAIAGMLGLLAGLFGSFLLELLGVRLSSFKIYGGLMLLIFGVESGLGISLGEHKKSDKFDIAAVPLASPLLTGPGAMSSIMLLALNYGEILTMAALAACLFVCLVCLRFSKWISERVSEGALNVVSRIMGIILVAFAVQFIMAGFAGD